MEPWYKFILYGTYDGFSRSTLGDDNLYLVLENGEKVEVPRCFVKNASDFIEKDKLKLKDVIARIKKLDLGTQKVWLNEILNKLGSDYGTLKYKAGYEQGKVEGALIHCEEPQKITVPQFVADWYEEHKDDFEFAVFNYLYMFDRQDESDFKRWFKDKRTETFQILVNMHQFGYTIEKEKRYIVKVKGVEESHKYLNHRISLDSWFFSGESEPLDFSVKHTRKELEEAGFEEVFNSPLFEVKEVEG